MRFVHVACGCQVRSPGSVGSTSRLSTWTTTTCAVHRAAVTVLSPAIRAIQSAPPTRWGLFFNSSSVAFGRGFVVQGLDYKGLSARARPGAALGDGGGENPSGPLGGVLEPDPALWIGERGESRGSRSTARAQRDRPFNSGPRRIFISCWGRPKTPPTTGAHPGGEVPGWRPHRQRRPPCPRPTIPAGKQPKT